ncbi:hypothetical protein FRA_29c03780 [Francisella sp. W12-1067]|nr:hypothetical protein FRA_29c03780 [Francisella sp. W12-1067]
MAMCIDKHSSFIKILSGLRYNTSSYLNVVVKLIRFGGV